MDKVKGRIVYCRGDNGQDYTIRQLNGAGLIISVDSQTDIAFSTLVPATSVNLKEGHKIDHYINTTKYVLDSPLITFFSMNYMFF